MAFDKVFTVKLECRAYTEDELRDVVAEYVDSEYVDKFFKRMIDDGDIFQFRGVEIYPFGYDIYKKRPYSLCPESFWLPVLENTKRIRLISKVFNINDFYVWLRKKADGQLDFKLDACTTRVLFHQMLRGDLGGIKAKPMYTPKRQKSRDISIKKGLKLKDTLRRVGLGIYSYSSIYLKLNIGFKREVTKGFDWYEEEEEKKATYCCLIRWGGWKKDDQYIYVYEVRVYRNIHPSDYEDNIDKYEAEFDNLLECALGVLKPGWGDDGVDVNHIVDNWAAAQQTPDKTRNPNVEYVRVSVEDKKEDGVCEFRSGLISDFKQFVEGNIEGADIAKLFHDTYEPIDKKKFPIKDCLD